MRKLLAALLLLASPAYAADLATKAVPFSAYPTTKCGLYYGANAEGGAGVVANAPAGTTVIGGDIGLLIGYACPIGGSPWFVEGIFDFQNLNAGNAGFSLSGPAHLEQRVGVQTPLLQILPSLPGFSSINTGTPPAIGPLLPPGASPGPMQNYVYGAVNEDDISSQLGLATARAWLVSPEVGTGILDAVTLSTGKIIVIDAYAGYEMQSNALCLGAVCPKLGGRYKTGVSFKY